jgi:hypothetical protein
MEARLFILAILLGVIAGCATPDAPRRAVTSGPYYEEIRSTPSPSKISLLPYCNVR